MSYPENLLRPKSRAGVSGTRAVALGPVSNGLFFRNGKRDGADAAASVLDRPSSAVV
jgi:hypothetical protein